VVDWVLVVMASAAVGDGARPAMVVEYVAGTPLSQVLSGEKFSGTSLGDLGAEVGRVVAGIGAVTFERPGFFTDEHLSVRAERPWSQQLHEVAETCMAATPKLVWTGRRDGPGWICARSTRWL
jgi:Ser/Thr protein kinase RdoA (MazF antagonist)